MKTFKLVVLVMSIISFTTLTFGGSAVKLFDTAGVPRGLEIVDGRLVITSETVPQPTEFQTGVIQRDVVTLSTSESSITIASEVVSVVLQKITGTVTMYINSSSNLAEVFEITSDDYSTIVVSISSYDTSLVFIGSGTVEIEQRRRQAFF